MPEIIEAGNVAETIGRGRVDDRHVFTGDREIQRLWERETHGEQRGEGNEVDDDNDVDIDVDDVKFGYDDNLRENDFGKDDDINIKGVAGHRGFIEKNYLFMKPASVDAFFVNIFEQWPNFNGFY